MGIKRLVSPKSVPSTAEVSPNDTVKSGQSNGATFAALGGVLTAIAAGIPGIIKATGVNSKTTAAQAAVIIGVLLVAAVGVISVAWVLVSDFRIRASASTTGANGANAAGADQTSAAGANRAVLRIVDEEAQLPVLTARYDAANNETVYLAVPAAGPPKWVKEGEVKKWITT